MRMIRKIRLQDFSPSLPWNTPQRSKAPLTLGWQQHPRGKRVLSGAGCYVRGGGQSSGALFSSPAIRARPVSVPSSERVWVEGFFPLTVCGTGCSVAVCQLSVPLSPSSVQPFLAPHGRFSGGFWCSTALRPALLFPADPHRLEEY